MKIRLTASEFCLGNRELIDLDDAMGIRIEARSGAVWVTQDGDPYDHVLKQGEAWTVDRRGHAIVQSLGASRVRVVPPTASAAVRAEARPVAGIASRARGAVPQLAAG